MEPRMIAILACIGLLTTSIDFCHGHALNHEVVKRSTSSRQRGTMTEERGREIEERARAGHREVINELNERFAGYKENCYPMPKGCRCTVGEEVIRHMDERQCKNPVTTTYRPGPGRPVATTRYTPSWRTTTTHRRG